MARAPIIISNCGIAEILSKGLCNCNDDKTAEKLLMKNINDMNEGDSVVKIVQTKQNKEAHCLYWRLKGDAKYEDTKDNNGMNKYKDGKEMI